MVILSDAPLSKARTYPAPKFASDVKEAADNLNLVIEVLPAPAEDEPDQLTKLPAGRYGAGHGDPWLDFRLDAEWPTAEARHGGGGEGGGVSPFA